MQKKNDNLKNIPNIKSIVRQKRIEVFDEDELIKMQKIMITLKIQIIQKNLKSSNKYSVKQLENLIKDPVFKKVKNLKKHIIIQKMVQQEKN